MCIRDSHIDVLRRYLTSASDFERQLADDGYLVVKFFVHVTKEAQKKRLTRLHDDPATRWRVGEDKLATIGNYEEAYRLYDNLLKGSDFSFAPWHLVNGEDKRRANLQIAETLVNALTSAFEAAPDAEAAVAAAKAQANSAGALDEAPLFGRSPEEEARVREEAEAAAAAASARAPRVSRFRQVDDPPCLESVDHALALDPETYKVELKAQQERLNRLEMEMYQKRIPLMIMYEGWDAAGKGGNIKRVAQALDAREMCIRDRSWTEEISPVFVAGAPFDGVPPRSRSADHRRQDQTMALRLRKRRLPLRRRVGPRAVLLLRSGTLLEICRPMRKGE